MCCIFKYQVTGNAISDFTLLSIGTGSSTTAREIENINKAPCSISYICFGRYWPTHYTDLIQNVLAVLTTF